MIINLMKRKVCLSYYRNTKDTKGNINQPLHTDYLNYRMKSIERRHKNLTHTIPHKLHPLTRQFGASLEHISEALTHSSTITTKTYINTPNVINMPVGEITYRKLPQKAVNQSGVNSKKSTSQTEL